MSQSAEVDFRLTVVGAGSKAATGTFNVDGDSWGGLARVNAFTGLVPGNRAGIEFADGSAVEILVCWSLPSIGRYARIATDLEFIGCGPTPSFLQGRLRRSLPSDRRL